MIPGRRLIAAGVAWLIIATSEVDAPPLLLRPAISSIRGVLLRRFRALVRDDPGPELARVARARIADRNTRPAEAQRLLAIADLAEQPTPASDRCSGWRSPLRDVRTVRVPGRPRRGARSRGGAAFSGPDKELLRPA